MGKTATAKTEFLSSDKSATTSGSKTETQQDGGLASFMQSGTELLDIWALEPDIFADLYAEAEPVWDIREETHSPREDTRTDIPASPKIDEDNTGTEASVDPVLIGGENLGKSHPVLDFAPTDSSASTSSFDLPSRNAASADDDPFEYLPVGTDNPYITGLVGGERWRDSDTSTPATTITYKFVDDDWSGMNGNGVDLTDGIWSGWEKAAFRSALDQWENVANIEFVEVTGEAMMEEYLVASGSPGVHQTPSYGTAEGKYKTTDINWTEDNLNIGGTGFRIIMHEIGHGLGLAHTHDSHGGSTIFPGVTGSSDAGDNDLNNVLYSTMSYNVFENQGTLDGAYPSSWGTAGSAMAFDIAAIQYLYGANQSFASGNDTYVLSDFQDTGTYWQSIWDTGGTDQIVYDGYRDAVIDLRAATLENEAGGGGRLNYLKGIEGGYTISSGVSYVMGEAVPNPVVIENARGGGGNDTITGNDAANVLRGDGGDDDLFGGDGHDSLFGGTGHDRLEGGRGNDVLEGGDGVDWLFGMAGNDTLRGNAQNDTLFGGVGDDTLSGGSGSDVIHGQDGDDWVSGGTGIDEMHGGDGIDTVDFTYDKKGDWTVNLTFKTATRKGGGTETITGFENVVTGNGDDVIRGTTGGNILTSGDGNDQLTGLDGSDILRGEGGNDTLNGGNGNDRLFGGDGSDTATYADQFSGVRVDLAITSFQNTVGAGIDTLISIENLIGSSHGDWLFGDEGNNTLEGLSGDDQIFGGDGFDVLRGGNGNDNLFGGDGYDILNGGSGSDWASYLFQDEGVWVNLGITKFQDTHGAGTDLLLDIENLAGSAHNDVLTGSDGNNYIDGHAGADIISAGDGSDVIRGGEGDDAISGGLGNDIIDGGSGNDWAVYTAGTNGGVVVDLGAGTQQTYGAGIDTLIGIENVSGSADNDHLTGTGIANTLIGNSGDDWIWGEGGGDTINGGRGADAISGGTGADTMIGGLGNDHMWGGTGPDTFLFESNWGGDWLWDFETGVDTLDFSGVRNLNGLVNLNIEDTVDGALISFGADSVLLIGVAQAALNDSDFIV